MQEALTQEAPSQETPSNEPRLRPPSLLLLMMELRAGAELGAFVAAYPWLRLTRYGDGHPVLVVPGLGASDLSTLPLRTFLRSRGYTPYGWTLGRNLGPVAGMAEKLTQHFVQIQARHARKVSVIGWSLGGIYARELAKAFPADVRQVITLCSPFAGDLSASRAGRGLRHRPELRTPTDRRLHEPPPLPTTAIYSRSDGIVAWQGCVEKSGPMSESIEIGASHCGMGHHPLALYVIADRLAQPESAWKRFDRSGLKRFVYPDPERTA